MASDEQAALLAQIQALSGAIDQHKHSSTNQTNWSTSSRGGSSSSRGYYGRGTGRPQTSFRGGLNSGGGKSTGYGIIQSNQNGSHPSRHRSLVFSGQPSSSSSSTTIDNDAVQNTPSIPATEKEGWVKRKSTHNMSLVSSQTFEKTEPARLAAIAATKSAKEASKTAAAENRANLKAKSRTKGRNSIRRGDNMGEVIIDGVIFEFDESGTKLVKKADQTVGDQTNTKTENESGDQNSTDSQTNSTTPLRTSINGQQFIRTKTGNLISQVLLDQRKENKRNSEKLKRMEQMGKEIADRQVLRNATKAVIRGGRGGGRGGSKSISTRKKTLCAYFNKTGQCKNGLSCPYKHDPSKLAICPKTLRPNGCPLSSSVCPLSHESKPERIPHCVHFLSTAGACRNGDSCLYTHPSTEVHLTNESAICMDFSDFGWCNKGEKCDQRHTWDCPEFLRKGKCDRRGCKLMHVVRVSNASQDGSQGARQLDDDDLFVRDDDAHLHQDDEEEVGVSKVEGRAEKRKREDNDDLHENEENDSPDEEDNEGALSFKSKKTKVFAGQDDFISFADLDDEEDEDEGEDEERGDQDRVEEVPETDSEEEEGVESVHSDSSEEEE